MARIHPSFPITAPLGAGAYLEREVLRQLEAGLPDSFDVFHNLPWSNLHEGQQLFGEYDLVLVSPGGHLLILEVKAGQVQDSPAGLSKTYGGKTRDVGRQMRRMHANLLDRIQSGELPEVHVGALLVLPEWQVKAPLLAYPRERIVDATEMAELCRRIQGSFAAAGLEDEQRQRVLDFLANRFEVQPDVACRIGQVLQASTQLASGLATWVPRISHANSLYVIEATAGSGKTQLALALLRDAVASGHRARYVCFNRPLADHLASLAPAACEVTTFHQLCRDHAERGGASLDFSQANVFERMTASYLEDAATWPARLDLLILDESQDLEPAWVEALIKALKPDGRLYLMGDSQQQLYGRQPFELSDAVVVRCMDNFRSPQRVVQMINNLKLTQEPVKARSAFVGQLPAFHVWEPGQSSAMGELERCLKGLWSEGYAPEQVAVISYRGVQQSELLKQSSLGGQKLRRFAGQYDSAGTPLWTEGSLLAESLYRFKGQSAPVVVLCEVDFEALTPRERQKLFVGVTRAQLRLEVVLSERAVTALTAEV